MVIDRAQHSCMVHHLLLPRNLRLFYHNTRNMLKCCYKFRAEKLVTLW